MSEIGDALANEMTEDGELLRKFTFDEFSPYLDDSVNRADAEHCLRCFIIRARRIIRATDE